MYTIRPYRPPDCPEMAQLFYNTVHIINARDYTPRQLDAWATGTVDLAAWDRSFRAHRTLVAEEAGILVGFGDMDETGYLDRLYVHHAYQHQGIASALCRELEQGFPTASRVPTEMPGYNGEGCPLLPQRPPLPRSREKDPAPDSTPPLVTPVPGAKRRPPPYHSAWSALPAEPNGQKIRWDPVYLPVDA